MIGHSYQSELGWLKMQMWKNVGVFEGVMCTV